MKRLIVYVGLTSLLLSGCLPSIGEKKDNAIQETEESVEETVMIPAMRLKDEFYKTLLPFKRSASRGIIVSNSQTKFDLSEAEEGLLRISRMNFDPEKHYFQEGQYIDKELAEAWLARSSDNELGLNPPMQQVGEDGENTESSPIYLSHISEQNYLTLTDKKKVKLAGISIGLSLNAQFMNANGTETNISDDVIEQQGKKMAEEVVKRLRTQEALQNIPIVIGLFKQESHNSLVPGTYFASSVSSGADAPLSEWKTINEKFNLLPAETVNDSNAAINKSFVDFKKDIDEYAERFMNVTGTIFTRENEQQSLRIAIPIDFSGTIETTNLTQYIASLLPEYFPNTYTEVTMTSAHGPEALIINGAKSKNPFIHLYGHPISEDQMSNEFYRISTPHKNSASRGEIVTNLYTQHDIREAEEGLTRISMQSYSPKNHYIQEGQYISEKKLRSWLKRSSADKEGLNAAIKKDMSDEEIAKKAPLYLAHIVEQDYMTKVEGKKDQLSGISIGLVMNSIYYLRGIETKLSNKEIEQQGMRMAEEIVSRLRSQDELKDVPIVVGLMKQGARNAIVPGTYFATATAGKGQSKPTGWKTVNEKYRTLPAKSETENYRDLNSTFNNFKQAIEQYFPSFVTVVGKAMYIDDNLNKVQIEIPIQFYGKAELIGFTQHLTTLVTKDFSNIAVEVNIVSTNGPEVLIVNEEKGQEPRVHIYGY